jgi:hypothetical protein
MSALALISRDDSARKVAFTAEADRLKNEALEVAALVGKVANADDNAAAVAAQMKLAEIKSLAEKARKAVKEPVLEFGKLIDATAKKFIAEVEDELLRLTRLIGDFQALEAQKARAAEALRLKELAEIERQKQEALAAAKSHDQVDAIQAHYNEVAAQTAAVAAPPAPVRAEGQVVRTDWEIIVTNPYDLAKFHPGCVNITPRLAEIKMLLAEGVTVKGITATKVTKAGVRLGSAPKAIEV